MDKIVDDLINSIKSNQNLQRKELSKSYSPTSMEVIGLIGPHEKLIVKELISSTKRLNSKEKIELAIDLVDTNIFECQHIAYILLNKDKKALSALSIKEVEKLGRHLDNWVSVDTYSVYIYGAAWRIGIISDEQVKKLLESVDFWQRRVAIVSTVALNLKSQGGTGDARRTLEVCSLAIDDHHQMIVKALSWALRELSKREPDLVEDFVEKYRNRLNSKALREIEHKIKFGTKN
jgi:3-methyladenine DNA glycosylase AlkD